MKFGRKRPNPNRVRCYLHSYVTPELPTPPASCDYSSKAIDVLRDMMLNDRLGDCVIAGGYHLIALQTGNASGDPFHATEKEIVGDYHSIGGYVPGRPDTDNGCDEVTALNFWKDHGFADDSKILGHLNINASNQHAVKSAMWLFENLVFGIELPDEWISPFPSADGFVWDVAGPPNPLNGHCVVGVGYNDRGVIVDSWGLLGVITWAALAKYCTLPMGELHVALFADQIAKGQEKAPNGFKWDELIADFDAEGGDVPAPTPAPEPGPSPAPVPTPGAGVTLAQAETWAREGVRQVARERHGTLITVTEAERGAARGLRDRWPK